MQTERKLTWFGCSVRSPFSRGFFPNHTTNRFLSSYLCLHTGMVWRNYECTRMTPSASWKMLHERLATRSAISSTKHVLHSRPENSSAKQSAISDYRLVKNPVPFLTSKESRPVQAVTVPKFSTYVPTSSILSEITLPKSDYMEPPTLIRRSLYAIYPFSFGILAI